MIGFLKSGSLSEGFLVRLNRKISPETLRIGDFVIVEGKLYDYFGIIEDMRISSSNEDVFFAPPDNFLKKEVLKGSIIFSELKVAPYLMVERTTNKIYTIKTIPEHFSEARKVNAADLEKVFMNNTKNPFHIGQPLTMDEQRIFIDLEKLCKRSNAIFGITGSGKTFLGRILFSGIIKNSIASLLIFDMHNEYGRYAKSEKSFKTQSLKALFPRKVKVFDVSTKNPDADSFISIPYKDVTPMDVGMLSHILNFSDKSEETAYIIWKQKGTDWLAYTLSLKHLKEKALAEKAEELNVNSASLSALIRHLSKLQGLDFLKDIDEKESSIEEILAYLRNGVSVVVQFSGKAANSALAYFAVANILTRRIHEKYVDLKEEEREKRRIMIVVEEAHKFLSTSLKEQNVFGTIAREMRKFNVTLFIIDQRPSEIDSEVLSQVGTRFAMQLMDERDMDAVFQGAGGGSKLKKILRSLQPQEVLLFGYAVPMPVAMRVRNYGEDFFKEVKESKKKNPIKEANDLY